MRTINIQLSAFFLSLFASTVMVAQSWDVSFITSSNGLSNSSVTCVYEDRSGRMWFGTWDGLNLFNGRDITVFKPDYDNPQSISNNIVRQILDIGDGRIWIATDYGLNRLDPLSGKSDHYFTDTPPIGEHNLHIAMNPNGQLFVNSAGKGLFYFSNDSFIRVNSNVSTDIKTMFFDNMGKLWLLSSDNRLHSYALYFSDDGKCASSGADETFENIAFAAACGDEVLRQSTDGTVVLGEAEDLGSFPIISSISQQNGHIIIGSAQGLLIKNQKEIKTVMAGIPILSTCISRQGIIWAGSDMRGVMKAYSGIHVFETFPFDGSAVRAFWEDSSDNLWVGTKGSGLWCLDKEGKPRAQHTCQNSFLSNDNVYCMVPDGEITWIGSDGDGLDWISSDGKQKGHLEAPVSSTYSILPHNGFLYVGTGGHGLARLEVSCLDSGPVLLGSKHYPDMPKIVFSLVSEDDGNILVGSRDGGLCRLNPNSDDFTKIKTISTARKDIGDSEDVICIHRGSDGFTRVGTSMGLIILSGDKVLTRIMEKDGLPNNTVHSILEDSAGHIWVSTNYGLARIDSGSEGWRIVSFRENDGLQSNEFADGAAMAADKGQTLYFGGIRGFNRFSPATIPDSSYLPPIDFEGMSISNEQVDITQFMRTHRGVPTLELSSRNRIFSFKFVPLDFNSSESCTLSYILEGYNNEWVNMETSSNIVFTNVPVGHHTLRVRCYNRDNVLNENEYVLPIRIIPVWYMSGWMIALYVIIIYGMISAIIISYRKQRSIRMEMAAEESKFVFFTNLTHEFSNSLTLICGPCSKLLEDKSLSPQAMRKVKIISSNSDRMRSLMQQIIDFRRAETGHMKLNITPVNIYELISTVTGYYSDILERESLNLRIETSSSDTLVWNTDLSCIEKIIFNLLSNAVKYTPSGHDIIIKIEVIDRKMELSVTNTGIGISQESQKSVFNRYEIINRFEKAISQGRGRSNGIGLALCKSLSEALGGFLSLSSDETSYTCFKVTLPYKKADPEAVVKQDSRIELNQETIRYDESSKPDVNKPSMLVVDDDQDIRALVRMIFEDNYRIREASDGSSALDLIHEEAPSIIITDVEMPLMNGFELIEKIKSDNGTRHIPVILLSAHTATTDQVKGLRAGADAYVTKPFTNDHLEAVAERLVGRGRELIDYSQSAYAALQQFNGTLVNKKDYELIKSATEIIFREMDNVNLTIEDIAGGLAITKMQLYRKMKSLLNTTPVEYVRNLRLDHAAKLLKSTNLSVQEIMYQCGFSSKSAFFEHFRERFGVTPGKYKKA